MALGGSLSRVLGGHCPGELGVVAVMLTIAMGFKPCPICGKADQLGISSKEDHGKVCASSASGHGMIHIICRRCDLELWQSNWESDEELLGYDEMVDKLRDKWNERAG